MAESPSVHPHLSGLLVPMRSEDDFDLKVVGRIPDALAGAYYRIGPNPQFDPKGRYVGYLGDGMIHAFFLEPGKGGGRAVAGRGRYRNRWVRTPKWLAENAAGRQLFGYLGEPSDPSVASVARGAANTHIVYHGGKLMALQEQSEPFEIDPVGLERGGYLKTGGKFTAHPKIDPQTGEMVWFAYCAGAEPCNNLIEYGVTDRGGAIARRRERLEAPYPSMIHDFMVTRNYVVFPVLPLTADRQRGARGLPALAWEPDRGAFLGVMRRDAGAASIRWLEIEPRFIFHAMNAWEEEGERKIHCEVMEFASPPVFPNADGSPARPAEGRLVRWTIDLAGKTDRVKTEQLDDLNSEMPRIDERYAGGAYRHGWFIACIGDAQQIPPNAIAHVDLASGKREVRLLGPGDAAGEPVFVPRSAEAAEGDGYVITLVCRAESDSAELLILNAQDVAGEPEAVLRVPRRVPGGFHGSFVGA